MSLVRIHLLTSCKGYLLLVFHTSSMGWQFRITNLAGEVFGMQLPYESADAAERVGRNWIDLNCGDCK